MQATVLTKGKKMIVTPRYHVFEMYKVHQDATYLPFELQCKKYEFEDEAIPGLSASASRDQSGKIHISLCNLNPERRGKIICELRGTKVKAVSGRVLTAEVMNSHNTFRDPEAVKPAIFKMAKLENNKVLSRLPAKSVVVLEIE